MLNKIFGANDIRGIYPDEINAVSVYKIANAFAVLYKTKKVIVGHDIRLSSIELKNAVIEGLTDAGCDVIEIGQCGTEMVYFSTCYFNADGGIMVTASHNPKEYNGLKLVEKNSKPISMDKGLKDILNICNSNGIYKDKIKGKQEYVDIISEYINFMISYIDINKLKPLKLVINTGNGSAGPIISKLDKHLPIEIINIFNKPDGSFPNGVPNPILVENREVTSQAVKDNKADLGVAFDGDFDRCFFFDENGNFIEGYYVVGLLAEAFLRKNPGAIIIGDARNLWNTMDVCKSNGGEFILSKSGHSFIKAKMREVDAIYGGEMSAHHYFREFSYCDSGMIPWLLIIELMSINSKKISDMVNERIYKYPISGEINIRVIDASMAIKALENIYSKEGQVYYTDGLSVEFENWRFNIRKSNTEPVVRLNVEAYKDKKLVDEKVKYILFVLDQFIIK